MTSDAEKQATLFEVPSFIQEEWNGMPEFHQEDLMPFRTVNVRFRNQEDVDRFAALMEQAITPKQKTIWFPFAENRRASAFQYFDEP
jgi:hypothetical protein